MTARLITVAEFAARASMSPDAVRRRIRKGRIKARNYGTARHRDYRIPESELDVA